MLPSQLIAEEKNWLKHCLARDAEGHVVNAMDETAVKFCAAGAILRFCGGDSGDNAFNDLIYMANEEVEKLSKYNTIVPYNNAMNRKHSEIVALLEAVEARAVEKGFIKEGKLCYPAS